MRIWVRLEDVLSVAFLVPKETQEENPLVIFHLSIGVVMLHLTTKGGEQRMKSSKIGGTRWRRQVQGGGGDNLMIIYSADKFPSDPTFCLFEC